MIYQKFSRKVLKQVLWRLLVVNLLFSSSSTLYAESIIANVSVGENVVSKNQLRLYFSQRLTQCKDGSAVKLIVLPDNHPLHLEFCNKVLSLYPYQLRKVWDRQVFSGTGQTPITLDSENDVLDAVSRTPGSIGYVSGRTQYDGIKILEME